MSSKITIIGAGSVGSTIAYTLSNEDIASEIVLIDINKKKVEGEVMDIAQGTCFRDPVSIIAGEYEDAKDSDIVIITSGIARKPGQTRIELTQTNVNILKSITPEIVKAAPNAIYIIVSNPVDIMTYVFTKISGLPENQILGSGTMLDSARLRCGLSEHLNIAQKNIHAYVFGEHGDTSFIPWSGAYVSGVSLDEYYETVEKMGKNVTKIDKDAMLEYVRTSGGQVIARKPGQTRIELTQTNVNILKSITPEIVKAAPNAIYIIVSNPVDIMTYVFTKISGLPENQILGSGTMLDSARLRCGLSEHLNIAQKNIHAYVFGEHGDTSFIPWSGAYVSGVSLDEYYETVEKMGKNVTKIDKDAMLEYVRTSGGQVIANKGATFYAVSVAVCKLVATILSSSDSVATVSSMMHGEYGIEEVCLSTLTLVGPKGVQGKIPMRMTKEEVEKLKASADALKAVIAQIEH